MDLRTLLIKEEDWVNTAYPDPLTKAAPWTIGVGHTGPEVRQGLTWTDSKIDAVLNGDIYVATKGCGAVLPGYRTLQEPRQAALIGMVFQMGLSRVLNFKHALDAISKADWPEAKKQMLDSAWARQTPARAERMAYQIETGEWSPYYGKATS